MRSEIAHDSDHIICIHIKFLKGKSFSDWLLLFSIIQVHTHFAGKKLEKSFFPLPILPIVLKLHSTNTYKNWLLTYKSHTLYTYYAYQHYTIHSNLSLPAHSAAYISHSAYYLSAKLSSPTTTVLYQIVLVTARNSSRYSSSH